MRLLVLAIMLGCAEERARPDGGVTGRIHPPGILDEASVDFHGRELARRDYDLALCATCHGNDFSGGRADVSCLQCHEEGPTACATCHREGEQTAPHVAHSSAGITCVSCHPVPAAWNSGGHLDGAPAEVIVPYAEGQCSNVYCHGTTQPRWNDPITGGCDRCHGYPPPSHAQNECATCHPPSAPHVDGVVQVGTTPGCDGCHGRDGDPAPPRDLDGNEFITSLGVGAHQAHLDGPSRLRGPIACTTCHAVPSSTLSPGHIDTARPAEVLTNVGWDRTSETCTAACHGPARPVWTQSGGAACGTCHGVPPATPAHATATSLASCAGCHSSAIDTFGNFLFIGGVSAHLDGDVDVD